MSEVIMNLKVNLDDTIAAISTPIGSGGIGIVRLSGSEAITILKKIFIPKSGKPVEEIKSHTITYGNIVQDGSVVDEVLVSLMKAPKTYTKEDVVEINCHGGTAAVSGVLRACLKSGARLAEGGEFTKRAFLNGRIDLAQAEAVADIISAKTDASKKAALSKLGGRLSKKIRKIRESILLTEATIEAAIEYPEHDEEEVTTATAEEAAKKALSDVRGLIDGAAYGKIITAGINAVILGKPNVGKSSFLNYILDEDRAIVTDIAGTTRDALRESVNIKGIPVNITDTAGIRQTGDVIEKIGVDKSFEYADSADVIFIMLDGSKALDETDIKILEYAKGRKAIAIINKSDLGSFGIENEVISYIGEENTINASVKEDMGLDDVFERLKAMFLGGEVNISDEAAVLSERNLSSLRAAEKSLENVIATAEGGFPQDFLSMDLTDAYTSLGEILGESLEEDVIDKIFSEFCLGK